MSTVMATTNAQAFELLFNFIVLNEERELQRAQKEVRDSVQASRHLIFVVLKKRLLLLDEILCKKSKSKNACTSGTSKDVKYFLDFIAKLY
mmetsp:Transcript_108/g.170  ORF Transcript_108/g.170 Transcript_108/m.170 type:complete len:91 (+) Transcript_108:287-559(+)